MRVFGIELNGSKLIGVMVDSTTGIPDSPRKLVLGENRDRAVLQAFSLALSSMVTSCKPDRIAIKDKPRTGAMAAGAAAIKMEAILIMCTVCPIDFISGKQVNDLPPTEFPHLPKYAEVAAKTAFAAIVKEEPGG